MPLQLRELSDEEVEQLEKKPGASRSAIIEEYKAQVKAVTLGRWVEAPIPADEKRGTIKSRLNRAAEELGLNLNYKRSDRDRLLFQVLPPDKAS